MIGHSLLLTAGLSNRKPGSTTLSNLRKLCQGRWHLQTLWIWRQHLCLTCLNKHYNCVNVLSEAKSRHQHSCPIWSQVYRSAVGLNNSMISKKGHGKKETIHVLLVILSVSWQTEFLTVYSGAEILTCIRVRERSQSCSCRQTTFLTEEIFPKTLVLPPRWLHLP